MIDDLMAQTATLGADSHMFRASAKKKSGGGFFASVGSAVSGFFGGGGSAPPASASERSAYEGMGNSSLQSKVSESGNRPRTAHAGKRGAEREEASDEAILAARNREIADLDKNLAEMSDLFLEVNGMVQEQGSLKNTLVDVFNFSFVQVLTCRDDESVRSRSKSWISCSPLWKSVTRVCAEERFFFFFVLF